MVVKEAIRSLLQEMILPEFEQVKAEQVKIQERLNSVDKRQAAVLAESLGHFAIYLEAQ